MVSYGLLENLAIDVGLPVNWYHSIAPVFITSQDTGGIDFGDLRVSAVWRFLKKKTWGLAVVPRLIIPTGDSSRYLGMSQFSGELSLAADKKWGRSLFFTNAGFRFREEETLANLNIAHEFIYGLGWNHLWFKKLKVSTVAEVFGSIPLADFLTYEVGSPAEASLHLTKDFGKQDQVQFNVGGALGLTNGYGSPDYRLMAGLRFKPPFVTEKAIKPKELILANVYFGFDKYKIEFKEQLDKLLQAKHYYDAKKPIILFIRGHTDSDGSNDYNIKLAQRRIYHVFQQLKRLGIPENRIETEILGETEPASANSSAKNKALNRRVQIFVKF